MTKLGLLTLFISTISGSVWAHEPYVAPLSYVTENTQTAIVSGYAEHALSSEYALKDSSFSVINPSQVSTTIKPESHLKSVTVFDLVLPEDGTYQVASTLSHPLKYALHNKEWKIYHDMSAAKAGPLAARDYVIPEDFKNPKTVKFEDVTREWHVESYVSKNRTSTIHKKADAVLDVNFSVHPNAIKAAMPVNIQVQKDHVALKDAQVKILAQGTSEDKAIQAHTNAQGLAEVRFPTAGQYIVEVSEKIDAKSKPKNQYYTIVSIMVMPN